MSTRELLINEIGDVPEPLLIEVLDFVHFLNVYPMGNIYA